MQNEEIVDFKGFAEQHKDKVYNTICSYFTTNEPKEFMNMVRSYTDRKGSYRRPSYTILWALLYGGSFEEALLPAAVQQTSEDFFLMHDDWVDGNEVRRGKPAAHVLYGAEYAVEAGDMLQSILWKMAYEAAKKLGKSRGDRYFDKFYDIMLTTHVGQYLDLRLTREVNDITKFTIDDYYKSIHAKSAYYSVYGPMQCGAIIANAKDSSIKKIVDYGTPAGKAFQIKDDILDCISNEGILGKSIGTDVKEGTKTIILWHAVHNSTSSTLSKLKAVYSKNRDAKNVADIKFVLEKFRELGSIEYAEKEAAKLTKEALNKFDANSKEIRNTKIKELARSSIDSTTKRSK